MSSDRGMSWSAVPATLTITPYDNSQASSPVCFYACGRDSRGRFCLTVQNSSDEVVFYHATQGGAWVANIGGTFTLTAMNFITGVMMQRAMGWIWLWAEVTDFGTADDDYWVIRRVKADDYEIGTTDGPWQTLEPSVKKSGSTHQCTRPDVKWCGDRWAIYTGNKGNAGAEGTDGCYWEMTRGWSKQPLGIISHAADFTKDSDVGGDSISPTSTVGAYLPLWTLHWNPRAGAPTVGGNYTFTGGGTWGVSASLNGVNILTSGVGGLAYYQHIDTASTQPWGGYDPTSGGRQWGSTWEFVTRCGTSNALLGEYGFDIIAACDVAKLFSTSVEVRIYGNNVNVYDVNAAALLVTVTVPSAPGSISDVERHRFRWVQWYDAGAVTRHGILYVISPDGTIQDSGVLALTVAGPVAVQNTVRWGSFSKLAAGALRTYWSEVSLNDRDCLRLSGSISNQGAAALAGFNNPKTLLGMVTERGEPVEVGDGLSIGLAGDGGAFGDSFVIERDSTYAGHNTISSDSPRISWRVLPEDNRLSRPNAFNNSYWNDFQFFSHVITDNSQTAPDGTLTASRHVFSDPVDNGDIGFLYANGFDQDGYVLGGFADFAIMPTRGWTFSMWVRNSSSSAGPLTLNIDVSDGQTSNNVVIPADSEWYRAIFYVDHNGDAGGTPSGWLDITVVGYTATDAYTVDLWGAKLTPHPEIVLAYDADLDSVNRVVLEGVSVHNCNARRLAIDTDTSSDFDAPTTSEVLDLARYGTDVTPWVVGNYTGSGINFTNATVSKAVSRELDGQYVYGTDFDTTGRSIKITRHRKGATMTRVICDSVDANTFFGDTENVVIYGTEGAKILDTPLETAGFVRVRIMEQEPPDGEEYWEVGSLVIGDVVPFGVPAEWTYTENEQSNTTINRTKSALRWAYREGPNQRTFTNRWVGDVNRWRDEVRHVLRSIDYEVRPLAMIIDTERPNETVVYGRVMSGSQQDHAGWTVDGNGDNRTVGDMSFTFEEEV